MSTEEEQDEELRQKYAFLNDSDHVEAIVAEAREYRRQRIAKDARVAFLRDKPTFQADDHPHDPWASRYLGCGQWRIGTDMCGQYGPTWVCPRKTCSGWEWKWDKIDQEVT